MLKTLGLSLFLLVRLGLFIPFISVSAESGTHTTAAGRSQFQKNKYSRQWRRAYLRRRQRIRALAAYRRAARLRQVLLADTKNVDVLSGTNNLFVKANQKSLAPNSPFSLLPSGEGAPKNWKQNILKTATATPNELQFRVEDESGAQVGAASISVVGTTIGADNNNLRVKTVGGISTESLRRTVIDRMIREEGWVVNDYQKDIGGKRVFVVAAQSPGAGGKTQSRLFYFTEADGRVYSVAVAAPVGGSPRVEQESESVVASLQRRKPPVQEASNR